MFQDEAGFGRISEPKHCWAPAGVRPIVPRHHIREYYYAYGAVEPATGENFFLVLPHANTICMNVFLQELSKQYSDDTILMCVDRASWHTTTKLAMPDNIVLFYLLPATPEMNPIEQIWKELRKRGFKNEAFKTLNDVVDRLCDSIVSLSHKCVSSITGRQWILDIAAV